MELQTTNLGKVAITIDKDRWNPNKDYDKLIVVTVDTNYTSYISRKPVPAGIPITNREYWIPFFDITTYVDEFKSFKSDTEINIVNLKETDKQLYKNILDEINRATEKENVITTNLNSEITNRTSAVKTVTDNLNAEILRATNKENSIIIDLNSEISRAKKVEDDRVATLGYQYTGTPKLVQWKGDGTTKNIVVPKTDITGTLDETAKNTLVTAGAVRAITDTLVPKETTVNGHALSANVTVTKSDVGLGNVDNTSDANKPVSTAQATEIAAAKKAGTDAQTNLNTHTNDKSNPHSVTKSQVGLGNVDNVKQIPNSEKGSVNGVATLDASGKVPSSQLPSYVDDVLEYNATSNFPTTGETGKIYVATSTNLTYRWSGTKYVEISASLALGETSSTAYAGDKGKSVADKVSNTTASNPTLAWGTKSKIGTINGTEFNVTMPANPNIDTNTTYTFVGGTNKFTVTPSGGTAQTVSVTPSIANNITGSGTNGYIAKFNGTNTITNGPAFTTSGTTKYLREDGTWQIPSASFTLSAASANALGGIKVVDKTVTQDQSSIFNGYNASGDYKGMVEHAASHLLAPVSITSDGYAFVDTSSFYALDSNKDYSSNDAVNRIMYADGTSDYAIHHLGVERDIYGKLYVTIPSLRTLINYDEGTIGSDTKPVYFTGDFFLPIKYSINANVPANAKFTDTTYSIATKDDLGLIKVGFNANEGADFYPVQLNNVGRAFFQLPKATINYNGAIKVSTINVDRFNTNIQHNFNADNSEVDYKYYGINLDTNNTAFVSLPWVLQAILDDVYYINEKLSFSQSYMLANDYSSNAQSFGGFISDLVGAHISLLTGGTTEKSGSVTGLNDLVDLAIAGNKVASTTSEGKVKVWEKVADTTNIDIPTSKYRSVAISMNGNNKLFTKIPFANNSAAGLVKLFNAPYDSSLGNLSATQVTGKNYPLQVDTNGCAFVNVNWSDTDTYKFNGSYQYHGTNSDFTDYLGGNYDVSIRNLGIWTSIDMAAFDDIEEIDYNENIHRGIPTAYAVAFLIKSVYNSCKFSNTTTPSDYTVETSVGNGNTKALATTLAVKNYVDESIKFKSGESISTISVSNSTPNNRSGNSVVPTSKAVYDLVSTKSDGYLGTFTNDTAAESYKFDYYKTTFTFKANIGPVDSQVNYWRLHVRYTVDNNGSETTYGKVGSGGTPIYGVGVTALNTSLMSHDNNSCIVGSYTAQEGSTQGTLVLITRYPVTSAGMGIYLTDTQQADTNNFIELTITSVPYCGKWYYNTSLGKPLFSQTDWFDYTGNVQTVTGKSISKVSLSA